MNVLLLALRQRFVITAVAQLDHSAIGVASN